MSAPAPLSSDVRRALLERVIERGVTEIQDRSGVSTATIANALIGRSITTLIAQSLTTIATAPR